MMVCIFTVHIPNHKLGSFKLNCIIYIRFLFITIIYFTFKKICLFLIKIKRRFELQSHQLNNVSLFIIHGESVKSEIRF